MLALVLRVQAKWSNFAFVCLHQMPSQFSWMNILCSFEKTKLSVETLKGFVNNKMQYYPMMCSEFYEYIVKNNELLKQIHSLKKYDKQ